MTANEPLPCHLSGWLPGRWTLYTRGNENSIFTEPPEVVALWSIQVLMSAIHGQLPIQSSTAGRKEEGNTSGKGGKERGKGWVPCGRGELGAPGQFLGNSPNKGPGSRHQPNAFPTPKAASREGCAERQGPVHIPPPHPTCCSNRSRGTRQGSIGNPGSPLQPGQLDSEVTGLDHCVSGTVNSVTAAISWLVLR